jgi:hypothetical protein
MDQVLQQPHIAQVFDNFLGQDKVRNHSHFGC